METTVVEDVGHFGAIGEGFARGIRYVFARRGVDLDAAILERYVGAYERAQLRLLVSIEGGHLIVQPLDQPDDRVVLQADSETNFYSEDGSRFQFEWDDTGRVIGMRIPRTGEQLWRKAR